MKLQDWIAAVDDGGFHHEWMEIAVTYGEHIATFRVSKNPATVRGDFESINAADAQQLADYLGCLLITPKLFEMRWFATGVKLTPIVSGMVKPGGNVTNVTAKEHSDAVWAALRATGELGTGVSIGGVGKAWPLDTGDIVNHGWPMPSYEKLSHQSDGVYWLGIKLEQMWTDPTVYLIQKGGSLTGGPATIGRVSGDAEMGDAHGPTHEDYSQKFYILHWLCEVNGVEMLTKKVLMSNELAPLAVHHGKALWSVRLPGVEPYPRRTSLEIPPPDTERAPAKEHDTHPSMEAINLGSETLRQALADLTAGVREELGRNDGETIRKYASNFGLKPPLNWCSVSFGSWMKAAAKVLGIEIPIEGSPGAQATMNQFKAAGCFVARRDLKPSHLLPGNVPIWKRPPHDWTGHIGVLESGDHEARSMRTIEANSGTAADEVARMDRSLDDPRLFGLGILNDGSSLAEAADHVVPITELAAEIIGGTTEPTWEGADPLADAETIDLAAQREKIVSDGRRVPPSELEDWFGRHLQTAEAGGLAHVADVIAEALLRESDPGED